MIIFNKTTLICPFLKNISMGIPCLSSLLRTDTKLTKLTFNVFCEQYIRFIRFGKKSEKCPLSDDVILVGQLFPLWKAYCKLSDKCLGMKTKCEFKNMELKDWRENSSWIKVQVWKMEEMS